MDSIHNKKTPSLHNYPCITRGKQQIADDQISWVFFCKVISVLISEGYSCVVLGLALMK